MGLSKAQLLEELMENNEFFDMMVDMIPSKLYISPRKLEEEGEVIPNHKYHRNQSKNDTKEARRAAAKAAKRRKLDPEAETTTSKLQKRLEQGTTLLPPPKAVAPKVVTPNPHQSRIDLLREKLHAKIAEKQQQNPRTKDPNQVSKRAARRAEKERRREEAKKRKSSSTAESSNANNTRFASGVDSEATRAADLAQVDFGRLAGLNGSSLQKNYEQSNKALQNLSKSKNLHKMLADAEAKRAKLEELKQGDEEAVAKAQKLLWSDTFKEADGQRIKDDPTKLKKVLKRKAAKKVKSQKAWQSRTAQVDKKAQDRQKIRQHNLQARKQGGAAGANLSKKEIRKDEDPGRRLSRAGFEGRKREFLNGDKKTKGKDQ